MNEVLRQRMVGLAVLLLVVFLLSLLLPEQPKPEQRVPAVTVSLSGETLTEADAVPPPDDLPPESAEEPATVDSDVVIAAVESGDTETPEVVEPAPTPGQLKLDPSVDVSKADRPLPAPTVPLPPPRAAPEALKSAPKLSDPVVTAPPAPGWYVQVGSYSKLGSAQTVVTLLGKLGVKAAITPITGVKGQPLNRVRAGPYSSEAAARSAQAKVARNGYPQSRLVREPSR